MPSGLGLGLNLGRPQQNRLNAAVEQGQGQQFLASHAGLQKKINRVDPTSQQATNISNYINAGQVAPNAANRFQPAAPAAAAPAPQGSPTTAAPKGGAAKPPAATPPPPTTTPPPATPPSFSGALTNQFGAGQPFDLQKWYGDNPLQTASDVANRELQKNLALTRAKFAGSGGGDSDREAIAEGTAQGEAATGLGDVLAARGIGARAGDLTTALQAFLGAGNQQLQGQQNQMTYAQNLNNIGNVLTQAGALEQGVPNASLIQQLLSLFSQGSGTSNTIQSQKTQSGFLGM